MMAEKNDCKNSNLPFCSHFTQRILKIFAQNKGQMRQYSCKNTLATLYKAREILRGRNMYVLSSDNWLRENMFHTWECGAWYSSIYMEGNTSEWELIFNKKKRITGITIGGNNCWVMYGPVYFSREFSDQFIPLLEMLIWRQERSRCIGNMF